MTQAAVRSSTIIEKSLATLPSNEAELIPLYEAYRAASAAMTATFNHPRTSAAARDILEDEVEHMGSLACAVAVKMSHLPSVSKHWRDAYVETMVSHAFYAGDCAQLAMAKARAMPVTNHSTH